MSDIGLGIGLVFDQKSLDQMNQIVNAFKNVQNTVNQLNGNLNKVSQATQKTKQVTSDWQNQVDKIAESAGVLVNSTRQLNANGTQITQTYKNQQGILTKITGQLDNNLQVTKLSVSQLNNLEKIDKERTAALTQEAKIREKNQKILDKIALTSQKINQTSKDLFGIISKNIGKVLEWSLSMGLVYGAVHALSSAFKTLVDSEEGLINIRKVLPKDADFRPIMDGAKIISQQFGVALTDTLTAAQTWGRQFKNIDDIITMTNVSMKAAAVTDILLESSYKLLSATMKQFSMNVSDSNHVIDVWNELSNNMRTSAEDLAQGMAKTGSAAKLMGIDFDRTAAIIGTLVEVTGSSGEEMGTVVNRAFSRIHTKGAIEQLKAVSIDALQPLSKTLDEIGLKWNEYTGAEQEAIAKSLGGTHHWQKLMALFSNYPRVIEATLMAYDSFDSANREAELALSGYNKKIEQLQATFQSLAVSVGNGVLPFIKNVVDGFRTLLTIGDGIIPKLVLFIGAIYGLNAAFSAYRAAVLAAAAANTTFQLSTGAIIGIVSVVTILTAAVIGAASSTDKLAEATTRLSQAQKDVSDIEERGRQINYLSEIHEKLYNKLQNVDKKSKDYSQTLSTYGKVQEQINKLSNEFGINVNKNLSQYDQERTAIKLLIAQIAELDKAKRIAQENEIQRQLNTIENERNILNKITSLRKNLETPIPNSLSPKEKINSPAAKAHTEIRDLIGTNPMWNLAEQMKMSYLFMQNPKKFWAEMDKYSNQFNSKFNDLMREKLGLKLKEITTDFSDELEDDGKKPTINAIFTNLTKAQVDMIKKIGEAWEKNLGNPFKKDINKYVFSTGSSTQFSMSSEIRGQLDDIFKPLSEIPAGIRKAISDYSNKMQSLSQQGPLSIDDIQQGQLEVSNVYQKYIQQLDESKFKLTELTNGLDKTSNLYKYLSQAINMIDTQKLKLMGESTQWTNMDTVFSDIDKKIQESVDNYQRKMDELSKYGPPEFKDINAAQLDVYEIYKKSADQLEDNKNKLQQYLDTLGKSDPLYSIITQSINSLDEKKVQLLKEALNWNSLPSPGDIPSPKFNEKQTKIIVGSLNSVGSALTNLGESASIVGDFITKLAENFDSQSGKFDIGKTFESFGLDILFKGIANVIQQLSQAFTDLNATPSTKYNRNKEDGFELTTSLKGYRDFEKNKRKLDDLTRERGRIELIKLANPQFGQVLLDRINKQIKDVEKTLENTIGKIKELLGTSIDDIAGSLQNALSATNYMDFLSGWNKNLYEMTREGLIRGFMASEAMQPLMKSLSDTITFAAIDGIISAQEIALIKTSSNAILPQMKALYESLGLLDQQFGMGGNSGSGGESADYKAGMNSPITYNNYISIHAAAFTGDRTSAETFLYWIRDGLQDIEERA